MKKIITLILLAVMVQVGFAQEEPINEMKTLITGKKLKFTGIFASPELKVQFLTMVRVKMVMVLWLGVEWELFLTINSQLVPEVMD